MRAHRRELRRRTTRRPLVDGNERLYKALGLHARRTPPARPLRRAAHEPGRRACTTTRPRRCTWSRDRRDRAGREDHVRPRVHARAPGPGVRPAARSRARPPTRATGRSPGPTLIEGDATLLMSLWAQQHLTPAELLQVAAARPTRRRRPSLDRDARDPARDAPVPVHDRGSACRSAPSRRGRLRRASTPCSPNPPDSTEQVLHPDKLAAREAPVAGDVPRRPRRRGSATAGPSPLQDTLGELQLRDHARRRGRRATAHRRRRRGRLGRRPGRARSTARTARRGVVLDTRWDTDADAGEFATALAGIVAKLQAARPERRRSSTPASPTAWSSSARVDDDTHGPGRERPRPRRLIGLAGAARPRATSTRARRSPAGRARSRA